jgi:hypothetical protein
MVEGGLESGERDITDSARESIESPVLGRTI